MWMCSDIWKLPHTFLAQIQNGDRYPWQTKPLWRFLFKDFAENRAAIEICCVILRTKGAFCRTRTIFGALFGKVVFPTFKRRFISSKSDYNIFDLHGVKYMYLNKYRIIFHRIVQTFSTIIFRSSILYYCYMYFTGGWLLTNNYKLHAQEMLFLVMTNHILKHHLTSQ